MRAIILLATAITLTAPALAQQKAEFIDGTYVFADGACDKLKALAAGGTESISTVPWYVTADGIRFWEGGCGFSKVSKGKHKHEWHVVASCQEEIEESIESYVFRRTKPGQFEVTLNTPGITTDESKPVLYTRCDVGKIPDPQ
jgi:hypothetical protein